MLERLEKEIKFMLSRCDVVYASKDCKAINDYLENDYKPFRQYWINKVGEDTFAETWNRVNKQNRK